ncbi:MAG: hypothetical protein NTV56_13645 [Alphaproteobacteria bacterium]|nr:hypothetical protein [Alphaproteobacteria bacterium]
MPPELTDKPWAQIRHDYEHTDRPVDDICAEHGVSPGTLRDRMRRWGWTRRRGPIPQDGPPPSPAPPIEIAAPFVPGPQAAAGEAAAAWDAPDDTAIVPRMRGAVARVLLAIEACVTRIGTEPMNLREMERSARVLASLTRTLRELSGLLAQQQASGDAAAGNDYTPEEIDAFRREFAHKIHALVDRHEQHSGAVPAG